MQRGPNGRGRLLAESGRPSRDGSERHLNFLHKKMFGCIFSTVQFRLPPQGRAIVVQHRCIALLLVVPVTSAGGELFHMTEKRKCLRK